jgi:hypothetical protein
MSRPVFLIKYLPRFLSGAKKISLSGGICRMIFSALLDVQMISLAAFTSAEQLMYVMETCRGCSRRKARNLSAGHPSASEHPAFRSGRRTCLRGFSIFAVSAMK